MNTNNFCVIMAGGIGSRFWPFSKTSNPKQFLDILGTGKTLIQETFNRMLPFCPKENIYIVTSSDYKDLVTTQLPEICSEQILLEPARRNTAPCIAYACYKIACKNKNANIIVAPSDHLIINQKAFQDEIIKGLDFVCKNNVLLTLGIKPSRPETGYGYIQINTDSKHHGYHNLKKVKTFTEKPNHELATVFVQSGEFFWNSGIFVWSLPSILKAFETFLPEINSLFKDGLDKYNTKNETEFIQKTYSECRNISIDYGIMEKAENVYVLCTDFGWSDLGTWGSLYENSEKDNQGNVINSKDAFIYNSKNSIIKMPDGKIAIIDGLENYIVVDANNMLLICKKENEQEIRNYVNAVKIEKGDSFV